MKLLFLVEGQLSFPISQTLDLLGWPLGDIARCESVLVPGYYLQTPWFNQAMDPRKDKYFTIKSSNTRLRSCHMLSDLIFRQLFDKESSTYSYLLADSDSREGVIIDPVKEQVDRDVSLIRELDLTIRMAVNTHCHADHITGTRLLRDCLLYTSPSPRDRQKSRMPSSA